jgi:hypothetical protein
MELGGFEPPTSWVRFPWCRWFLRAEPLPDCNQRPLCAVGSRESREKREKGCAAPRRDGFVSPEVLGSWS